MIVLYTHIPNQPISQSEYPSLKTSVLVLPTTQYLEWSYSAPRLPWALEFHPKARLSQSLILLINAIGLFDGRAADDLQSVAADDTPLLLLLLVLCG